MNKFERLALVSCGKISLKGIDELASLSFNDMVRLGKPDSVDDLIAKTSDCDAIIAGLDVDFPAKLFKNNIGLKYIGLCGSNLTRVDLNSARKSGVEVKNVVGYCDQDTAHFPILEVGRLVRRLGAPPWQIEPRSLVGRSFGVVGLGATGLEVAKLAGAFGMNVLYFSRTRKPVIETSSLQFSGLNELLERSDFISLHTPPRLKVFEKEQFEALGTGKILVNTCVGQVFDLVDLLEWLDDSSNIAIMDSVAASFYRLPEALPDNLMVSEVAAYKTSDSYERLTQKVVLSAKDFLASLNS